MKWPKRSNAKTKQLPTIYKTIKVDINQIEIDLITTAASKLAAGKVGIFPTRCLYGLGTNAFDPLAIEQIFTIKRRPSHKPLLVLISHMDQLDDLVASISSIVYELMRRCWPGKVTFLLKARPDLPAGIIGPDNKIGIRLTENPVTTALVTLAKVPIIGTSANFSGQPGYDRIDQMDQAILSAADIVIDAGVLKGGIGSSIVDATLPIPKMLRHGTLNQNDLEKVWSELQ
jgi:L-threonylcarbamoyladenylate synthase